MKNNYLKQLFTTTNVSAMIIAFITTLLTIGGQYFIDNLKVNSQIKDSSVIIYSDMINSIESIELTISINNATSVQVLKNPHTRLDNTFINYVVNIKSKLSKDEYNSLITYYRNVTFLESIRKEYWELDSQEKIAKKGIEYIQTLKLINESNELIKATELLNKLKEISE